MHDAQDIRIEVVRFFPHPPERVFDAWLDVRLASRFLFSTDTGDSCAARSIRASAASS